MFPLLSREYIRKYIPAMISLKVSERARKPDGFLGTYFASNPRKLNENYPGKSHDYMTERENFIKRHLVQYKANPTERRRLALIAWAFDPKVQ